MNVDMRKVVLWIGVIFLSCAVAAQEAKLSFKERLQAEEDREYKALIESIKSMPTADYKAFLNRRVNEAYSETEVSLLGFVVVDVTDEINQPEPNFFRRLFSSRLDKKEFGINKVKTLLNTLQKNQRQSNESKLSTSDLVLLDEYQSFDTRRSFQQIEGRLSKQEAKLLISHNEIIDFHSTDPKYPQWSTFTMIDTPTGRVLPPQKNKQYDLEFIHEGLYQELLESFDISDQKLIRVDINVTPDESIRRGTDEQREQEMEDFLDDWSDYEFKIFTKSDSNVYMFTTKNHVEAMKEDHRVSSIQDGTPAFRSITKPRLDSN